MSTVLRSLRWLFVGRTVVRRYLADTPAVVVNPCCQVHT